MKTWEAWDKAPVDVRRVRSVEWACWACGGHGPGFMPEHHASGACDVTRTAYRMIPEVAHDAQNMVATIVHGATHHMDGGGI